MSLEIGQTWKNETTTITITGFTGNFDPREYTKVLIVCTKGDETRTANKTIKAIHTQAFIERDGLELVAAPRVRTVKSINDYNGFQIEDLVEIIGEPAVKSGGMATRTLPALTGTTTQIEKAEAIRNRIANSNFRSAQNADWFRRVARRQTLASWYISSEEILNSLVEMEPRKESAPEVKIARTSHKSGEIVSLGENHWGETQEDGSAIMLHDSVTWPGKPEPAGPFSGWVLETDGTYSIRM